MTKALFLDRDGVINIDKNYTYKIEDFDFIDGIFEFCKQYQDRGYLILVITNQAGIARGYYSEADYTILTNWMLDQFKKNGVIISKVYHCPHHPDFTGECDCRKPNPGMILQAQSEFDINLGESILVGNKESDIEAGRRAGIKQLILIETNTSLIRR